jgi:hypothetical protein
MRTSPAGTQGHAMQTGRGPQGGCDLHAPCPWADNALEVIYHPYAHAAAQLHVAA